jgi:bifunctional non-homologous end joining protein LigD
MARPHETLEIGDQEVTITNPGKVFFPESGLTKLDLVRYYLAVAPGVLRAVGGRPMALKRYVNGVDGQAFYQKRAPESRPEWIQTVTLRYPSGRSASEIVVGDAAALAWVVNLGCIDLHPHAVRAVDLAHPDELRIDLDPIPGVGWSQVREVALVVRDVLADYGLTGWPKTSGSRGLHIYCRLLPGWTFPQVHRAGLALARETERRIPDLATSLWWKEERHGVFIDYNQNAKDRTTVSAYSVRPTRDARISTPLRWDEVPACDPGEFTVATMIDRFVDLGDLTDGIDESAGDLGGLIDLAAEQAAAEPPKPRPTSPSPTGRRRSTMPLIEIARAATTEEAMAGLDRWKERHPEVWPLLSPADILVDSMRGRSSTWVRIRLNLRQVPSELRPPQEPLEVDFDPWHTR